MSKLSGNYLKIVEWSEADQCYIGSAPPLVGKCCHGDDEAKVYKELCQIVEEWIAIMEKDGKTLPKATIASDKEFSGKFMLRINPDLHKALALRSIQSGKSLNAFVEEKLMSSV